MGQILHAISRWLCPGIPKQNIVGQGLFDQQPDPLVFCNLFQVLGKNSQNDRERVARLKNNARFGLSSANYSYVDYLFVKICKS